MAILEENLYLVGTEREAHEVAGYLVFEATKIFELRNPPKLSVSRCWFDPAGLIEAWYEVNSRLTSADQAEWSLTHGVGLRCVTLVLEAPEDGMEEGAIDKLNSELVEKTMQLADSRGVAVNYSLGQEAHYFSLARKLDVFPIWDGNAEIDLRSSSPLHPEGMNIGSPGCAAGEGSG